MCRRRRICLRQQTSNAPVTPTAGWRRQLPAVQFNRSRLAQHVRMYLKADLAATPARSISLASPRGARSDPKNEP